jgi:radical SAM superfamily enzyme YgiQ (UPF0313 family)
MKICFVAMSGVRVRTAELAALGVTLPGFVERGKIIASLPSLGLMTLAGLTPHQHEVEWPQVVEDAIGGRLQAKYSGAADGVFQPALYAQPRFELLNERPYNRVTIQTSRGCPRGCEFCGASPLITRRFNQKPVRLVMDEIRSLRTAFSHPFIELADDNTFLDKAWSRDFLQAMIPEQLHWFTETDASVADDLVLCDLLAESGCRQLLIGFESPREMDLAGIDPAGWKQRVAPQAHRVVDTLQSRGVSVNGCFILGLDTHTPDVFPMIRDFVRESGLAEVQLTVMTPFPGTRLYDRLRRERRLLSERFWDRCTLFDVNYRPARMAVDELEAGLRWLFKELYSRQATSQRQRSFAKSSRISRRGSAANTAATRPA